MNFNTKSIRFNTWLYFIGFSLSILIILGGILSIVIKPYYRNNKIETINVITDDIEKKLLKRAPSNTDVEDISKLVIENDVCALIFNDNNSIVFDRNSLGELCMLDHDVEYGGNTINFKENYTPIKEKLDTNKVVNDVLISKSMNVEMLLYGEKISSDLSDYYLILNTPLEPVESYIDFIMSQYVFIAIAVVFISILVAFLLARRLTKPILQMKSEANKLAEGDYSANFKADSYTEINELANTLDDATNKLSKVDELRKDLVANVSHDIKTPLTVIQSYAEMIKDISGDDPKKREEHLDVILKETEYLNKLITDMQEYSKMQAGFIELNNTNFDLSECANRVIGLLSNLLEEKNIIIKKELSSVIVYADEMKISQVIYNFISNAIKHSKEKGTIEVKVEDRKDKVRLEVKDYGSGISEEALPYIWDRYYKIDKGFNRNMQSTGLGLAIAKAILEGHKSNYGVISKENVGSTFYFELSKDYEKEIK